VNGLYLYCFTPPGTLPGPDLAGFGTDSISGIPLTGFTLWVERLGACPVASVEATLRHHAVVERAWTRAPACLPVRFGQWFRTLEQLESSVDERRTELEAALAWVAGAGEHGLRIVDPEEPTPRETASRPAAPRAASGRAYLEAARDRVHRREGRELRARSLAESLEAALGDSIRAQRADPLAEGQGLVTVAHLVARERAEQYAARVTAFEKEQYRLRFIGTGPWPPYSFTP
jgi:hypothetical protein